MILTPNSSKSSGKIGNPYDDVSAVGYFTANGGKILAVKRPPTFPPKKTPAHGFPEIRVPYCSITIGYPRMSFAVASTFFGGVSTHQSASRIFGMRPTFSRSIAYSLVLSPYVRKMRHIHLR